MVCDLSISARPTSTWWLEASDYPPVVSIKVARSGLSGHWRPVNWRFYAPSVPCRFPSRAGHCAPAQEVANSVCLAKLNDFEGEKMQSFVCETEHCEWHLRVHASCQLRRSRVHRTRPTSKSKMACTNAARVQCGVYGEHVSLSQRLWGAHWGQPTRFSFEKATIARERRGETEWGEREKETVKRERERLLPEGRVPFSIRTELATSGSRIQRDILR